MTWRTTSSPPPRGNTAPIWNTSRYRPNQHDRVARFARADCEPCLLLAQCASGGQRDIRLIRREDLRLAHCENSPTPTFHPPT